MSRYLSELEAAIREQPIKAISCDVFDTLIFRHAGTPVHLWHQLAECAYQSGVISNNDVDAFVEYRKEAEVTARRNMMQREGHREVGLKDIYACWQSVRASELAELEQQLEYDNWCLNPVLVDWLISQQQKGVKIVLVSDMYLPSSLFNRFFTSKAPQLALLKIHVSGECKASKQDGRLYQNLLNEHHWQPGEVLHIGDDRIADVQMAKASGLHVCHVPLDAAYLAQLKYEQRLYAGGLPGLELLRRQSHWHSDGSFMSELANRVYGPVLYAFARWIVARCHKLGIHTIYCLLREGDVIARVIELLPAHQLTIKQLSVSRRSSFLPSREWSMDLVYQLCQRRGYTLAELIEDLGLICSPHFAEYVTCTLAELAKNEIWPEVLNWLSAEKASIEAHLQSQRQLLQQYLAQAGVQNSPEIAIIDWGCGASLFQNLHQLIGFRDVQFFMFYASNKANRVALSQRLQVFQPGCCKAWAQQIAASPEVSEILLNGTLFSTRAYVASYDGVVLPVSVPRSDLEASDAMHLSDFTRALLQWVTHAVSKEWLKTEPDLHQRKQIFTILYRFICYPMWQEAHALANLPLPLAPGKYKPLLPGGQVNVFKERIGYVEQAYQLLIDGNDPILNSIAWYPGLIALAFPDQLQHCGELTTFQDDDKIGPVLLSKLQQHHVKTTAIYGAGELGLKVYDYLTRHGINVSHVIDQRAESSSFYLEEHKVISLKQAKSLGVTKFAIASRAFRTEIIEKIEFEYKDYSSKDVSYF